MGWKLANRRQPDGSLLDASKFSSIARGGGGELCARRVRVPTQVDAQRAMENAGGLASDRMRSLELWWDGPGRKLDVVLVAERDDMPAYEQDFAAAYVNASFENCPMRPEWYDCRYYVEEAAFEAEGGDAAREAVPRAYGVENYGPGGEDGVEGGDGASAKKRRRMHAGMRCTVFDVGYRHGHVMAAFDANTKHDTITQVSSVMQLAKYAWVQTVFCRRSFAREMQSLSSSMRSKYAEFTESKHVPTADLILSTSSEPEPKDHAEKKGDFAVHHQALQSHLVQKMQDEQVMVSVRGLLESEHDVDLDWSGIGSVPSGGRSIEHLISNEYGYAEFVGLRRDKKMKKREEEEKKKKKESRGDDGDWDDWDDSPPEPATPATEPPDLEQPYALDAESAAMAAAAEIAGCWKPDVTLHIDGRKEKNCTRLRIFEERLMPDASAIRRPISKYVAKSFLLRRYGTRRSPPFVIMTLPELGLLLRLPDAEATPNITITRQQIMPQQQQQSKSGFCLGFFDRARSLKVADGMGGLEAPAPTTSPVSAESAEPEAAPAGMDGGDGSNNADEAAEAEDAENVGPTDPMFGQAALEASQARGIVLSPEDIPTHIYLTGGTKSGKTTLIRNIAKHLELANLRGTFPNAFIFVDPKGSDSYDFLRQCESESYDAGNVTFLDPIDTKFSINVLELPPYKDQDDRQVVVSQYVGYIMQMIEYWYQGSDAFVRLKRILDTLLQYVYLQNDKPTFLDIYEIIVSMQQDGEEMLVRMYKELGMPEDVLKQAIQSVASLESKAYEPALNRLEKFATDPILRHMFCVRESTIDFADLIAPGSFTVIRLSQLNIPQHIITLTKQTLVIKLWFAIQERAQRIKLESERTQVLLALDEFQDLAGLPVIEAMLTMSRSYGLGLLLAHQSTAQLDDNLFEIIIGNAGTQFVGRVSGRDAGRFGDAWDPAYAKEYKRQLATQAYHHWTARMIAGGGETQPPPIQFWPVYVPPRRRSEEFLAEFISSQKARYGSGRVGDSMMRQADNRSTKWLLNVPYEHPSRDEWHVMCALRKGGSGMTLKSVVAGVGDGTTASDTVSGVLRRMMEKKMVVMQQRKYILPREVSDKYFAFKPSDIGSSEDIPLSTSKAVEYYLSHRMFLCVATQTVKRGKLRTDLVAYDYDTATPISVEIESYAEMKRHPEHVKLNMTKWADLGFEECHVWSTHPGIADIREGLAEEQKRRVRTFVVEAGEPGGAGGRGAGDDGGGVDDDDDDDDGGADGGDGGDSNDNDNTT